MNVYQTLSPKQLDLFPKKDTGGREMLVLGSSLRPAGASCLAPCSRQQCEDAHRGFKHWHKCTGARTEGL